MGAKEFQQAQHKAKGKAGAFQIEGEKIHELNICRDHSKEHGGLREARSVRTHENDGLREVNP